MYNPLQQSTNLKLKSKGLKRARGRWFRRWVFVKSTTQSLNNPRDSKSQTPREPMFSLGMAMGRGGAGDLETGVRGEGERLTTAASGRRVGNSRGLLVLLFSLDPLVNEEGDVASVVDCEFGEVQVGAVDGHGNWVGTKRTKILMGSAQSTRRGRDRTRSGYFVARRWLCRWKSRRVALCEGGRGGDASERELMESKRGKEVRERVMEMRESAKAAVGEGGPSRLDLAKLVESWKQG
ncbi:hypothetical protein Acr_03g0009170 [Actinidia rufa]|uniref:Uncharacterized protein n=1 Tax=Actinidia rufa TaxID=165716 RepID=A0A7J0ECE8_9ERIC|nr:hypothetical protein Acr_03g0009170 [Actinidia rufa]